MRLGNQQLIVHIRHLRNFYPLYKYKNPSDDMGMQLDG